MTKTLLVGLFSLIFLAMVAVCVFASFERGMFEAGRELFRDRWFLATLCDAYCGFLTFYVWVAYRETTALSRVAWFIGIMLLGNLAMSVYVLLALWKLPAGSSVPELLRRP